MIHALQLGGLGRGYKAANPVAATATKSLLHLNGSNGSTTFTDETGKVWTPAGNAQISTAQSQFGGASGLFDASGDYLTSPDHSDWSILGDFTVEAWIRRTALGRDAIFSKYASAASGVLFDIGASDDLRLLLGTGSFITCSSGPTTIPINTWTHVAGVKDGTTLRVFINGTQAATLAITGTVANSTQLPHIGRDPLDVARDFGGYIDEFRFSSSARYTSNFTPSGSEFTYP